MEDFIQIKKNNILKIGIQTEDGKPTGECWEFDLEDIELPLRLQNILEEHKKNQKYFEGQMMVLEKKEDHKGKKLLSFKEEEFFKIWNSYCQKEMKIFDMFLGENGCNKYLNGRKPYYTMFNDIEEAINSIMPLIQKNAKKIGDIIKNKYKTKRDDVIE